MAHTENPNYLSTSGFCITTVPWTLSYEPREEVIREEYRTLIKILVPEVYASEIDVSVKNANIEVKVNLSDVLGQRSFVKDFEKSFPVEVHYNVKEITSHLIKGVLVIEIPYKKGYNNNIEVVYHD